MTTTLRRSANMQQSTLLTCPEVAEALRVDDATVRRWIKRGVLEAVLLPAPGNRKQYRVKHSTLAMLLNPGKEK